MATNGQKVGEIVQVIGSTFDAAFPDDPGPVEIARRAPDPDED